MIFPQKDLNSAQAYALAQFATMGHIILYGPRQSGKSTVLQWIIATQPAQSKIALVGTYGMNQSFCDKMRKVETVYGNMNVDCITPLSWAEFGLMYEEPDRPRLQKFDLVVVDNGIIHPCEDFKTASAYSDGDCQFVFGRAYTHQLGALHV